ncbi:MULTISPECIES: CHAT domain-containing protein [Nostocales]|uniref:CHAT domain-containing protein n=3 Tax=Nostocales TaxID=1161 RepID=A0A8S9TAX0_9CYAN|nr:CHAT domain-containing protein [Tolypothrix bouteillei]KAF3889711.1 CHAT domain-containing protein [Tolypothrix bouteillei VB521301]
MLLKQLKLSKLHNFFIRIYRRRSLFLAALLFTLSTISPVIAKVSVPISIAQAQQEPKQLTQKASELYRNGKFEESATVWEQLANIFATQGDSLNQAMAFSNLSLTYQQFGQWNLAEKVLRDSLKILENQPDNQEKLKIYAQSLDIQGNLQSELGQLANALKSWQEATKIYSKLNEPDKLAQSKINQAQAMQDIGLYNSSCDTLLEVLAQEIDIQNCQKLRELSQQELEQKLTKVSKNSSLPILVGLRSLGELFRFQGQPEFAETILNTSINLAQKLNSPWEQAAVYLSMGNTLRDIAKGKKSRGEIQDYEQRALSYYNKAILLSPLLITRQQAQLNRLNLLLKSEEFQQAEQLWRSLEPQIMSLPPSRTGVYLQINFAHNFVELAQTGLFTKANSQLPTLNEVDRVLSRAVEQSRSLGDKRSEAYALGYRGNLYMTHSIQNLPQAEELTKQALRIASTFDSPDVSYQFFWQLGQIRRQRGDIKDAIAAYTKAYDALQSLRNDLVALNPEVQFSFQNTVEPVYRELVELDLEYAKSLKSTGKNRESQELLVQARNVIESLQLAELNNFFKEACVEEKSKQIDSIDRTAAVVYTIVLQNRLEVILSLPNQEQPTLSFHTYEFKPGEFEDTVDKVQRSLTDPNSIESDWRVYYKKLYDWLIQPIETELKNSKVTTLAFVLDADLRNLPMSILYDGEQYLLQKYAIALTPGLQLVDPKPIAKVDLKVFTAGLSKIREGFEPHKDFKALNYVERELEQIKQIGLSDRLILNEKFTSTQLKKEIFASRIPPLVHLATHGEFSSKASETFILAWDERISVKRLGDLLRDARLYQSRPIELLVLSACATASGDKRAALGLAGVAVRSGARSTIATLWPVVDQTTTQIMGEFYSQLEQAKKTNLSKAQALRKAQLAFIDKYEKYRHPHFWAPFVLVGNWQ